jgi:hypothetical protein
MWVRICNKFWPKIHLKSLTTALFVLFIRFKIDLLCKDNIILFGWNGCNLIFLLDLIINFYLLWTCTFDDSHEGFFDVISVEGWCLKIKQLIFMCEINNLLQFYAPLLLFIAFVPLMTGFIPMRMQTMFYWEFSRNYLIHLGMFS